jgi:DNA-directed RNA polymerase specialized sigma24 family protein
MLIGMPTPDFEPLLAFAAERRRFETIVLRRYAGTLTREDAEDIVSEALLASATECPVDEPDRAHAWFARVVLNRAEDLRRSRHGRPRSSRGPVAAGTPATRRFVALDECPEILRLACDTAHPEELLMTKLQRAEARAAVRAALRGMDPLLAKVLWQRHLARDGEPASRAEAAAALDVSIASYERLYTRARRAFIDAATGSG